MTDSEQCRTGKTLPMAAVLALSIVATANAADPRADQWLNVQEHGASGSEFSTTAATTQGTNTITVADVGDFQPGQGVMISKCHPRVVDEQIWGPRHEVVWGTPLKEKAEIRGYNGDQGDWLVLILDVAEGSKTFRWSEDICRTWQPTVPITGDWQPLRDGIEVRFNEHDWEKGWTVVFSARGQLATTIEKIEGHTITLRDAPTRSAEDAVIRHCDDAALQTIIDRAVRERRDVFIPAGRYRLSKGLVVRGPEGISIEGGNADHAILDISEGEGACITMSRGKSITLRNLTMVGHSGFEARDQCGHIPLLGSSYFWGFGTKNCNATTVSGTERVLIENCHGRRMASECFVSSCRGREAAKPGEPWTEQLTYLRCSAVDCGRNAFNDVTCGPENTSVLECRIVDVGGCSWEGASRFVRFIGNYVRNAGTVAMGNLGVYNRDKTYPQLGAGQHIIQNNVFESSVPYGGCAIRTARGATQVIVADNLFVNFGSSCVEAAGWSNPTGYCSANTTIRGNIFDMTEVGETSKPRTVIQISASDTIISDNQIYVRGNPDPKVTAILVTEPAVNISVQNNLIRGCGPGLVTDRARSSVGEVVDRQTFEPGHRVLPLEPRLARQCEGWRLVWLSGGRPTGVAVIDAVLNADDPAKVRFTLTEPQEMVAGQSFALIPPSANWSFYGNTIDGCLQPVVLDSYGSETSILKDNTITRGGATGLKHAIAVRGRFNLIGNHIRGFDEADCAALELSADPLGNAPRNVYRDNVFAGCARVFSESVPGLWSEKHAADNVVVEARAQGP